MSFHSTKIHLWELGGRDVSEHEPSANIQADDIETVLENGGSSGLSQHLLNVESRRLGIAQGEQELLAVEEIKDRIKLLDHQLNAAHRALFRMGSGALFADEVGLGKTIEIGMVLKEMDFRETHHSFLVLTPAQLAPQWQKELKNKFGLEFVCNYDDEFSGFDAHDKIVASVDTAKMSGSREEVLSRRWDVLVLDEAHYVRNRDTIRYELIDTIDYGQAFFATATPIQNDITDLYNIINLVRPGLLGTKDEFERRFVADKETSQIKNADELQKRLQPVMIRNRREETKIDFTNRRVQTNTFEPSASEQKLYESVTDFVRSSYSSANARHLVMLTLEKEVVSSPRAVDGTISRWLERDDHSISRSERNQLSAIRETIDSIDTTTKQKRLSNILGSLDDQVEETQAVVFTQFRPTQQEIAEQVRREGYTAHIVNGDLSSRGKERVVGEFKSEGGVLIATDSISEGRNLQFCNVMVNYDLPWNPMKVEQRIGRIDRIGQDREVFVFNLALEGTVEEHVLDKLYGKINLFNQSIGGLREILSRMEKSGSDFEREVFERLRSADDAVELENNFEEMAVDLEENKEAAEKMDDFNKSVFDNFEFTGGEA
ncbi:Helicase conserved C-terminal domain-containing protein [Halopenitus malekzadehii]|uniref:Helicase conserved C-terminal domain-containing protein n=1 Tax=Halopenitus malekzadehii TaxID=1267564 RepID=A0A1H6K4U2_9EURY|nr:Helicase conserved C-terminal domain-containing protein [Halopenitus malekzadehii]